MFARYAFACLAASLAACTPQIPMRDSREGVSRDAASVYRENFQYHPVKVACPSPRRAMIAVILGQSNAANHAERLTKAGPKVVTFYRGACYTAVDPILGATGQTGSVWPAFGDAVIASGEYDAVILVPAAVGSSRMESWAPGGVLSDRVALRLSQLREAGYKPTHFLIQQGESEGVGGEDATRYRSQAVSLLRDLRSTGASVVMATATRCMGEAQPSIRTAQSEARKMAGALPGPDADAISDEHRINGCHYDAWAQREMASRWAESVL